jgi:hypothetical protein
MALLKPLVDFKYNVLFGSWLPIYPLEHFPLIFACLESSHVYYILFDVDLNVASSSNAILVTTTFIMDLLILSSQKAIMKKHKYEHGHKFQNVWPTT